MLEIILHQPEILTCSWIAGCGLHSNISLYVHELSTSPLISIIDLLGSVTVLPLVHLWGKFYRFPTPSSSLVTLETNDLWHCLMSVFLYSPWGQRSGPVMFTSEFSPLRGCLIQHRGSINIVGWISFTDHTDLQTYWKRTKKSWQPLKPSILARSIPWLSRLTLECLCKHSDILLAGATKFRWVQMLSPYRSFWKEKGWAFISW